MNIFLIVLAALFLLFIVGHIHRRKQAKNRVLHIIENNCTGCQRCVKRCRRKALDIVNSETGRYVVLNPDKCTSCGDCVSMCKFNALEIVNREYKG